MQATSNEHQAMDCGQDNIPQKSYTTRIGPMFNYEQGKEILSRVDNSALANQRQEDDEAVTVYYDALKSVRFLDEHMSLLKITRDKYKEAGTNGTLPDKEEITATDWPPLRHHYREWCRCLIGRRTSRNLSHGGG